MSTLSMPEAQAILRSRGIAPADYEDALFRAATGDLELLRLLLAAGAGVNCYRFQKGTPLTVAVEAGKREAVRLLLQAGAAPDPETDERLSMDAPLPLALAARKGELDMVKLLVESGADPDSISDTDATPLGEACMEGHLEVAKYLLSVGAQVNSTCDVCYSTVLMDAVQGGNPACVRLILDAGADVNARNVEEDTALTLAICDWGNPEMVEMLIEAGADLNSDVRGITNPMSMALRAGESGIVLRLLHSGAHFYEQKDYYAEAVLQYAPSAKLYYNMRENGFPLRTDDDTVVKLARLGCSWLLNKTLEAGGNPDAADAAGKSALAWALEHPRHAQGCAVRLIKRGAQFDSRLLVQSVRRDWRELLDDLLAAGADVNAADEQGNTALHSAARKSRDFFVRRLLAAGADCEVRNNADYTPLLLAIRHRRYAAAGALLEQGASRSARGGRHGENAYELCMRYQCEIDGNKLCRISWPAVSAKYGFQA